MSQLAVKIKTLTDQAYVLSTTILEETNDLPDYTWQVITKSAKNELTLTPGTPKKELPRDGYINWELNTHHLTLKWQNCYFKQHLSPILKSKIFKIELDDDEYIYGFGEWFNQFGEDDIELNLYNSEAPAPLQHYKTYGAYPLFMSSKGYMILVLNASKAKVKLNRAERFLQIEFSEKSIHYLFVKGKTPKELLENYTEVTGRASLLPKWAFGLWHTSFPVEAQHKVLERVEKHAEHQIPLQAIILDYHWEKSFHDFNWRRELYPEPQELIKTLNAKSIELAIISTPYMNSPKHSWMSWFFSFFVGFIPKILNRFKIFHDSELYQHGLKNDYYVHPKITWWLGRAGAIDFTNKKATEWWFSLQKKLLDIGVRFIKNDAGEHLPKNAKAFNGLTGTELHNVYAFYYAKETFLFLKNYFQERKRPFILSRSSWAGTHRYPALFLGDQKPNFEAVRGTMKAGLNLSVGGHAYWGADVLGLYGMPTEEEFIGQIQWSLLTPIARYFSSPKLPKREPWSLSEKALSHFKKYSDLRLSLLPLYYRLAYETEKTGHPIVRPLFFEYPDDLKTAQIWNQVLLGPGVMICPKTEVGQKERQIYFPEGTWFDFWTGNSYIGPSTVVVKLTEDLPIYIESQHLLVQKAGTDLSFNHLFIEIFPIDKKEASVTVYDDAGDDLRYTHGEVEHQKITLSYNSATTEGILNFAQSIGSFSGISDERTFTLSWKHFASKIEVEVDQKTSIVEQNGTHTFTLSKLVEHSLRFKTVTH